jgi:hypothetical protein
MPAVTVKQPAHQTRNSRIARPRYVSNLVQGRKASISRNCRRKRARPRRRDARRHWQIPRVQLCDGRTFIPLAREASICWRLGVMAKTGCCENDISFCDLGTDTGSISRRLPFSALKRHSHRGRLALMLQSATIMSAALQLAAQLRGERWRATRWRCMSLMALISSPFGRARRDRCRSHRGR